MTNVKASPILLTLRRTSAGVSAGAGGEGAGAAEELAHTFDAGGGSLGRADECDLVLDDPGKYISRVHGRISFAAGAFVLRVVGTNPCNLNDRVLNFGDEARLVHGDLLQIGDFTLEVQLSAPGSRPTADLPALPPATPSFFAPIGEVLPEEPALYEGADPDPLGLNLFGGTITEIPRRTAQGDIAARSPAYRGAESDHFPPERQALGSLAIPDDYDPLADRWQSAVKSSRPTPTSGPGPAPVSTAAPSGSDGAVLRALLDGLGLPDLETGRSPTELAHTAGALLRAATTGTMGALMGRTLTKRESRVDVTVMGPQANNPLKFLSDADTALRQLLTNANPGYLPPVPAMNNAFDDLKAHELAMISAMRTAMGEVLQQLSPRRLERELQADGKMDVVFQNNRKARLWDSLQKTYESLSRGEDVDLQKYFDERFSAAYALHMKRLRRARK